MVGFILYHKYSMVQSLYSFNKERCECKKIDTTISLSTPSVSLPISLSISLSLCSVVIVLRVEAVVYRLQFCSLNLYVSPPKNNAPWEIWLLLLWCKMNPCFFAPVFSPFVPSLPSFLSLFQSVSKYLVV